MNLKTGLYRVSKSRTKCRLIKVEYNGEEQWYTATSAFAQHRLLDLMPDYEELSDRKKDTKLTTLKMRINAAMKEAIDDGDGSVQWGKFTLSRFEAFKKHNKYWVMIDGTNVPINPDDVMMLSKEWKKKKV